MSIQDTINCYIEFPWTRDEIIDSFKDLSDRCYQQNHWILNQHPHMFWSAVSIHIDYLFDDLDFTYDSKIQLDAYVRSEKEFNLIYAVMHALKEVQNQIGENKKWNEYWTSPLWDQVVEAAQKAYEVFKHNDEICENIIKEDIKDSNYQIHDPKIRQKLIETFKDLSNQNHQKYQWIIDQSPTSFWHQISASMIYLLQELNFKETPQDQLKAFIRSKKECEVIDCVIHALEEVETHIGPNKEWDAYWNSPLWDQVVEAALYAYNVLICNDEFCRKMNERKA